MDPAFLERLHRDTEALREQGLYKAERVIRSRQGAHVVVANGEDVINLCANNYLGLAGDQALVEVARQALAQYGFGMASVRFICGTQTVHKELEQRVSEFLGTEDTILYSSCFDANGGLFETLLDEQDAVISDALNHASIIDGIRLCKGQRLRYANNDMDELEARLGEARGCRTKLVVTDGVFSMDGSFAKLERITELAERHGAIVAVDDSHAIGFIGPGGRGTPERSGVQDRIDIITGTLGKALGGAAGGFTSGRREIIAWLRQRSRPYLFSNTLPPVIAATSIAVLDMLQGSDALRHRLHENSVYFRRALTELGFELLPGEHPIIPVMIGDAALATRMADGLLREGVYVIGFSFPVVPRDQARIRTQMSAAHSRAELERAVHAFAAVGRELGVIR